MATEKVILEVETRKEVGKGPNKRMRRAGRLPANVYGLGVESFSVSVEPRRVEELLRSGSGRNTILTLSMKGAGESRDVMIREIQRDPVSEYLRHVDFIRVDPDSEIVVRVPIHLVGTPEGVKTEGGLLDFIYRDVPVKCKPSAIPEFFEGNVEELHIGQHLSVKDLQVPDDIELLEDLETVIVVVSAPKAEEEPEPVEGEEEGEGEVPADGEAAAEGETPAEPKPEGGDS